MKKSDIPFLPEYYDRYINLISDIELSKALEESLTQLETLDIKRFQKLDDKKYAPDKWSVKDIIQHLIDTERIFNYRVLLFAREDNAVGPAFDHDEYVKRANADKKNIEDLIDELKTLRKSTISLYKGFDNDVLLRTGQSWKYNVTILAMGFLTAGHQMHHLGVIREKYFPLAG